MRLTFFISALLFVIVESTVAKVQVAFFELRDVTGRLVQFEPGGRFGHVAVSIGNYWLQTDPHGVSKLSTQVNSYGFPTVFLVHDELDDLSFSSVESLIGLPSNMRAPWHDDSSTYCAKLVAKVLKIEPKPMNFDSVGWRDIPDLPVGQLGISPDEIYRELLRRGFKKISACDLSLNTNSDKVTAAN